MFIILSFSIYLLCLSFSRNVSVASIWKQRGFVFVEAILSVPSWREFELVHHSESTIPKSAACHNVYTHMQSNVRTPIMLHQVRTHYWAISRYSMAKNEPAGNKLCKVLAQIPNTWGAHHGNCVFSKVTVVAVWGQECPWTPEPGYRQCFFNSYIWVWISCMSLTFHFSSIWTSISVYMLILHVTSSHTVTHKHTCMINGDNQAHEPGWEGRKNISEATGCC